MNSETKTCQNCKNDFIIEPDDFSFYEKIKVPPPTFCPLCRAERRFVFRNEKKLFRVKDFFSGEDIFSLYPENNYNKSVTREEWHSDNWDATKHAQEYNFSESFFNQIFDLERKIPINNLNSQRMINSLYSANSSASKNCYLCFNANFLENCMYGNAINYSKDCIDNSHIKNSERCYECFWLDKCYQCYFSIMSVESHHLWFCRDCLGCNDCFGCVNLRKSSYCIFNKQYSKEEYEKEIEKMKLNSISGVLEAREKSRVFWQTQLNKYHQGLKNLNSSGSYVSNCKNVNDSYLTKESENMRYCQYMEESGNKDNYDTSVWGENTELNYETIECGDSSYNNKFSRNCWPSCKSIEYSINLFSCSDCFACVGLKKKQYCILNKQYTKEEYFELREKIIKHMNDMPYADKKGNIYKYGEFFPIEFSPFGYNNTIAIQHFELNENKAKEYGYPWLEIPRGEYKITKKTSELSDSIDEVSDEILKDIIECSNCKNPYRILENEFLFYKKENLPLPNMCEECRFQRRIKDRLKIELYNRKCMCAGSTDEAGNYKNTILHQHGNLPCEEKFKTGYDLKFDGIVYCESCYQKEIY